MKILKSGLWYLRKWGMNPVFTNVFKKPLTDWSHMYLSDVKEEDIVSTYNTLIKQNKKVAGVALLPSKKSRVVVIDVDEVRKYGIDPDEKARKLSKVLISGVTPRGGLRIAFAVSDYLPHRITVVRYGEKVGEGGGSFKHLWTFPPSVAVIGGVKKRYYFVLPNGKKVIYPWELPTEKPPTLKWEEGKDLIELVLHVEIQTVKEVTEGTLKVGRKDNVLIPIPCWRTLEEFIDWFETEGQPPLPECVNYVLTHKVPRGMRFTLGAVAVMFLGATVARADPEEIISFVGKNLEDFPSDEGEPLNTKLSRLLVKVGDIIVPKYGGLGSLAINLPKEICLSCSYLSKCRKAILGRKESVISVTDKFRVWYAFTTDYWLFKTNAKRYVLKRKP